MRHFQSRRVSGFQFQGIVYEKKDWLPTDTINRPRYYNSYSTLTLEGNSTAFHDVERAWESVGICCR